MQMHMSAQSSQSYCKNTLFSNQVINPQKQKTQKHKNLIHESTTTCSVQLKTVFRQSPSHLAPWDQDDEQQRTQVIENMIAVLYPWLLLAIVSVNEDEESSIKFHAYVI